MKNKIEIRLIIKITKALKDVKILVDGETITVTLFWR